MLEKWHNWVNAKPMLQQAALAVAFLALWWWAWSLLPDGVSAVLGLALLVYWLGGRSRRRERLNASPTE